MRAMITIAILAATAAGARIESDVISLGPHPPIERFPPQPYIEPPTLYEVIDRHELIEARRQKELAIESLLTDLNIDTSGMTEKERLIATIEALEASREAIATEQGSTAAMGAIGGLVAGLGAGVLAGRKLKGSEG